MILRANVRRVTGVTTNLIGVMRDGVSISVEIVEPAVAVEIIENDIGYAYFRLTANDELVGDSLFFSIEEAKQQALLEYDIDPGDWSVVSNDDQLDGAR